MTVLHKQRNYYHAVQMTLGPLSFRHVFNMCSITFLALLYIIISTVPSIARVHISEFMASNATVLHDNDFYEYNDWIELFNDDPVSVDISGWFLTDNLSNSSKWRFPDGTTIPAGNVLLIWADGRDTTLKSLHTSFKLSADGEELALYSNNGQLVDDVTFPEQITDISMGRNNSTDGRLRWFAVPGPGLKNGEDGILTPAVAPEVVFSATGGIKNAPFSLELNSSSGTIVYTTDCSTPTSQSIPYTTSLPIDSTIVIKARTFQEGRIPGPIITQTYLFNYQSDLPVFSITTDSAHLWDDSSGIYCTGVNGIHINEDWGGEAGNYNQRWERPINIEMYDSEGLTCFNQTAGIRIQGEFVRLIAQKPFSIYGRNSYSGSFNYRFFPQKSIAIFNNFILRPGGNDWVYTMFNEGAINNIVGPSMDIDIQAYRPSVLFLNGTYWGLYNIREKVNEDYLLHNLLQSAAEWQCQHPIRLLVRVKTIAHRKTTT